MRVHWFLPTTGDGRDVVGASISGSGGRDAGAATRAPTRDYLAQVARGAEAMGFESVLTPAGTWCEDPWVTTAALLGDTSRLSFIVALRPSSMSPTTAAQMSSTFQRMSGGRLHLNIVAGGDPADQHRFGDWLEHDERYVRTDEFLTVMRGAWSGTPLEFEGRHYRVAGATVAEPPDPLPTVFLGGASEAAARVSARHADVHLLWAEPPEGVAEQTALVRSAAARTGRTVGFGLRVHVISRDSAAAAWSVADRMLAGMDPAAVSAAQARFATHDSAGQQRMTALRERHGLEVSPNLWAGFGLLRPRAGTALVGSHEQVADRLADYAAQGIEHVILSGQPHLEEAYAVGEGLLPVLERRGLLTPVRPAVATARGPSAVRSL